MIQNKVEFSATKQEFVIELREKVAAYFNAKNISKNGNANLVLKTIFMFSLYIAPYILVLSGVINSLSAVFLMWVIIGLGKAGVGMGIMHDANHRSYSKSQKVNKWLSRTLFLLGGFPANWQHQHNTLHHGYTNVEGFDEDISPVSLIRLSPHKPLKSIHKYQFIYAWFLYGMMTMLWATTKDFKQFRRYKTRGVRLSSTKSYRHLFIDLLISKVVYYVIFMIIPMLVLPFAWYWIILFFLTMHFTSGFILTIIFQTVHVVTTSEYPLPNKNGSMENNWAVHQLTTTSDYSPNNKVFTWLIGGLNYQIEHHLFPNISHVHYDKIASVVKDMAHKYNLPYHVQPGFLKALWNHAIMLKRLGKV